MRVIVGILALGNEETAVIVGRLNQRLASPVVIDVARGIEVKVVNFAVLGPVLLLTPGKRGLVGQVKGLAGNHAVALDSLSLIAVIQRRDGIVGIDLAFGHGNVVGIGGLAGAIGNHAARLAVALHAIGNRAVVNIAAVDRLCRRFPSHGDAHVVIQLGNGIRGCHGHIHAHKSGHLDCTALAFTIAGNDTVSVEAVLHLGIGIGQSLTGSRILKGLLHRTIDQHIDSGDFAQGFASGSDSGSGERQGGLIGTEVSRCQHDIGHLTGNALRRFLDKFHVVNLDAVLLGLTVGIEGKAISAASGSIHLDGLIARVALHHAGIIGEHLSERGGIGAGAKQDSQVLGLGQHAHVERQFINIVGIQLKFRRNVVIIAWKAGLIVEHVGGHAIEILPRATAVLVHDGPGVECFLRVEGLFEQDITRVCPHGCCGKRHKTHK